MQAFTESSSQIPQLAPVMNVKALSQEQIWQTVLRVSLLAASQQELQAASRWSRTNVLIIDGVAPIELIKEICALDQPQHEATDGNPEAYVAEAAGDNEDTEMLVDGGTQCVEMDEMNGPVMEAEITGGD